MNILATPEFSQKISTLSEGQRHALKAVLSEIQYSAKDQFLSKTALIGSGAFGSIHMMRVGELRIFLKMVSDEKEDKVILLDIAQISDRPFLNEYHGLRDPRTKPSYNPHMNHSINPIYNSSLNPIYNTSINPTYNTSINPIYNSSINPIYNTAINPIYNTSINPIYNTAINPIYNPVINPHYNPSFGGPFFYANNLNKEGYFITANDNVIILFDNEAIFKGVGVKNTTNGYCLFDKKNDWTGYLVPDKQGGYLHFDRNNNWIGFVV